jgi:hypothetical protein
MWPTHFAVPLPPSTRVNRWQTSTDLIPLPTALLPDTLQQMLVLDRLSSHDLVSARLLLRLTRESGHWGFRSAVPEYAPFAYSLAGAAAQKLGADGPQPGRGLALAGAQGACRPPMCLPEAVTGAGCTLGLPPPALPKPDSALPAYLQT